MLRPTRVIMLVLPVVVTCFACYVAFQWGQQSGWNQGRKALREEAYQAGAGQAYLDPNTMQAKWRWLAQK